MLLDLFMPTPDIRTMPSAEARIAIAIRMWVVMGKLGRDPIAVLRDKLGSTDAAMRLHLLLEQAGAAWVDPFCVNPPCCPRLSPDEALILEMVGLAAAGDRPGFDRLLSDMLREDVRSRLYASAKRLAAVV